VAQAARGEREWPDPAAARAFMRQPAPVGPPFPGEEEETYPKICLAVPVRNRAWCLPEFLEHLAGLDYPLTRMHYYFLVNNSEDESEEIVRRWLAFNPARQGTVEVWNREVETDARWDFARRKRSIYGHLAQIRNRMLDFTRSLGPDWRELSVDCDNLLSAKTLRRLVGHGLDAVAATASNDLPGTHGTWKTTNGSIQGNHDGTFIHADPRQPGLREVAWTGVVLLLSPRALASGARYAASPVGEDWPFCQDLRERGIRLWQDGDCVTEHLVTELDLWLHQEGRYFDDVYAQARAAQLAGAGRLELRGVCQRCSGREIVLQVTPECPRIPPVGECRVLRLALDFLGGNGRATLTRDELEAARAQSLVATDDVGDGAAAYAEPGRSRRL